MVVVMKVEAGPTKSWGGCSSVVAVINRQPVGAGNRHVLTGGDFKTVPLWPLRANEWWETPTPYPLRLLQAAKDPISRLRLKSISRTFQLDRHDIRVYRPKEILSFKGLCECVITPIWLVKSFCFSFINLQIITRECYERATLLSVLVF